MTGSPDAINASVLPRDIQLKVAYIRSASGRPVYARKLASHWVVETCHTRFPPGTAEYGTVEQSLCNKGFAMVLGPCEGEGIS